MKVFKEFKAFALKGNMADLAIGVIIGSAFNRVVNSIVNDLILPPLGLFLGGIDFSEFAVSLQLPGSSKEPISWHLGSFLASIVDFLIVAWVIFIAVKLLNRIRGIKAKSDSENVTCSECRMSIPKEARKCAFCQSVQ